MYMRTDFHGGMKAVSIRVSREKSEKYAADDDAL